MLTSARPPHSLQHIRRGGVLLPTVVPTDSRPLSCPPIGALPRNRLAASATGGASPISPPAGGAEPLPYAQLINYKDVLARTQSVRGVSKKPRRVCRPRATARVAPTEGYKRCGEESPSHGFAVPAPFRQGGRGERIATAGVRTGLGMTGYAFHFSTIFI